jgi:hypothetical protein
MTNGKLRDVYLAYIDAQKNDQVCQKLAMERLNNIPLELLRLSPRTQNRLKKRKVTSLGELLESTWEELTSKKYIDKKTVEEIDSGLKRYLSLYPIIIDSTNEVDFMTSFLNEMLTEPSLVAQLENANVPLDKIPADVLNLPPRIKTTLRKANVTTIQQLCASSGADLDAMQELSLAEIRQIAAALHFFLIDRIDITKEVSRLYELAVQLCKFFESHNLLGDIYLPTQAKKNLSNAIGSSIETLKDLQQAVIMPDSTIAPFDLEQALTREPAVRESISWLCAALQFNSIDEELNHLIRLFEPREQLIFTSRYGGEKRNTLEVVGKMFGISRARVWQIEVEVLQKLTRQISRTPLLYSRASVVLLRRLGEAATLELWKKEMLRYGLLQKESYFEIMVAVYRATDGFEGREV